MKVKYKKISINLLYIFFIIFPFYIFMKDFFVLEEIKNISLSEFYDLFSKSMKQSIISALLSFLVAIFPAKYIANNNNFCSRRLENLIFYSFSFSSDISLNYFSILLTKLWGDYSILYSLKIIVLAHVFYNSPIFVKYMAEALKKIPKL